MIKSLTFTGEYGYISEKVPEPTNPIRGMMYEGRKLSAEEKEMFDQYKRAHRAWAKNTNAYNNPTLAKNLLDRTFYFEPNRINLIFGPNASGKTTILKALVDVEESNDKITPIESVYFWCLKQYREQGKKKLGIEEFRDDL